MDPSELGKKYDKIAQWWRDQHINSNYGVAQLERAVGFAVDGGKALDVGCGAGGRLIQLLENNGFCVTGLDVSKEMVRLAGENHPTNTFFHQDICTWESSDRFNLIVAWDSIFHLPYDQHRPVLEKLCGLLASDGVLIYTLGNAEGEHTDQWRDDTFYYSFVGINSSLELLINNHMSVVHLELDQYPEKHAYVIAKRSGD